MISQQEVLDIFSESLKNEEFAVYLQPQYNHSTGMLIGAEALIRWISPKYGMISPMDFIPVLEENGLIPLLDTYVFEHVCRFQKNCIETGLPQIRISVNLSRCDITDDKFIDNLESIRQKYEVPTKLIHLELTETAVVAGLQIVVDAVNKLHSLGYTVEMDDFGSGYSSLNVLKDINFDVIKLDLKFIAGATGNARGGTILTSVVRMAKWLELPVIAEGVELVEQADFLRSVGCDFIQGYLYSRPLPMAEYEKLLSASNVGAVVPQMSLHELLNAGNFWNPESQETLIFSNFVGAAAIIDYHDGTVDVLRVNKKYMQEMGMHWTEKQVLTVDPTTIMDKSSRIEYLEALDRAIKSGDEEECETWRNMCSKICGDENICIRSSIRMIGESKVSHLFYVMVRNITAEKKQFYESLETEHRFKQTIEQLKVFFWEYTVATKEMRPCFRCQRELGLPPLMRNYPEPVIESGLFPADYADMYRDWHKQIANGVKYLEAVIPLTENRIPHRVRYTTEFDEAGHPIKAYGSATPEEE